MRGGVFLQLAVFFMFTATVPVQADDRQMIDTNTERALEWMRASSKHTAKLLKRSAGVLVFPDMFKMGFGVGGEFGEGALVVKGKTVGYYAIAGKSFGLDAKPAYKAEVIVFKTAKALKAFRDAPSWKVGRHAVVPMMASATNPGKMIGPAEPIVGLIFTDKGLISNLSLQGSKVTRISR